MFVDAPPPSRGPQSPPWPGRDGGKGRGRVELGAFDSQATRVLRGALLRAVPIAAQGLLGGLLGGGGGNAMGSPLDAAERTSDKIRPSPPSPCAAQPSPTRPARPAFILAAAAALNAFVAPSTNMKLVGTMFLGSMSDVRAIAARRPRRTRGNRQPPSRRKGPRGYRPRPCVPRRAPTRSTRAWPRRPVCTYRERGTPRAAGGIGRMT